MSLYLAKLRNKVMHTDKELEEHEEWQRDIPFDTRQLAIKEAIGSYKSGLALLKNKRIKYFKHSFKRKKDRVQVFHVDKSAFKNNKIFIKRLGKKKSIVYMRKKYKKLCKEFLPNGIESDFIIQRTNTNKYYIILSKKVEKENENKLYKQIALDPGVRTFQTGYSPEGLILECGKDELDKIKKLQEKMDILQSLRTKGNKSIIHRIHKLHEKCCNIVDNLHRQVVSFLTTKFSEVFLPEFNTKKMLAREGRNINSNTARNLQALSFYKFKQLLKCVGLRRNTNIYIVCEKYTTKTCGNCGIMNEIGSSKIHKCSNCGVKLERDINAARNIFMKNTVLDTEGLTRPDTGGSC